MKTSKEWIVYMIELSNGAYYTGITTDLNKRLKEHKAGRGSKYVRSHLPVKGLVYQETALNERWAKHRESKIKKMTRVQKDKMISREDRTLYYTYEQHCTYSKEPEEQWGEWETHYEWSLGRVFTKSPQGFTPYWNTVELDKPVEPNSKVYLVVVRYSSGNTFGRSEGNGTIAGIYTTLEQASEARELVEQDKWPGYAPWNGYFESLESVSIEVRVVEEP